MGHGQGAEQLHALAAGADHTSPVNVFSICATNNLFMPPRHGGDAAALQTELQQLDVCTQRWRAVALAFVGSGGRRLELVEFATP